MLFTLAGSKRHTLFLQNSRRGVSMKQSLRCLLLFLLAVAFMPARAFSQQVNDRHDDDALREKAYKLLETLAEEIGSLRSGENRARLGSNIAMSLWPRNEAKAREMFATVKKDIKAGLEDKDPKRYRAKSHFIKLREDTALRIGMFDPDAALQFLKETTPTDVYVRDEDQNELNLQLAIVFAGTKPDLSVKLGRESLKRGVTNTQLALIYALNKKFRDHASELLAEIVKVAPYQDIRHTMEREQFYIALARLVETSLGRDPAFRDLMKYFADLALEAGCGKKNYKDSDGFCYRVGLVVPFMDKVDAKRVAPLKHLGRKAAFPYEWSPELAQYVDVYENGSIDDLLAMIPMFPDYRDAGQGFAIRKIMESGDFERARKLANEFTWRNASDRPSVLKLIDDAQRIINEDTSAEILREAEDVRRGTETPFLYLFRMANEIGSRNRQTTVRLLDRANELLDKADSGKWETQWRIGIAVRYCQVKSDRCFTVIEPVVRRMNELVSAAAKLNDFDNQYLADDEWIMTAEGGVGSLLTMMAQNAVYFALCDFDRAIAMSSQFERREIRMMAQLKLAQGVLEGPPKKPLFADVEQ
jgi:hypothetical protein